MILVAGQRRKPSNGRIDIDLGAYAGNFAAIKIPSSGSTTLISRGSDGNPRSP
jgi:hypothetical protein